MGFGFKNRWANAREHTKGFAAWRREIGFGILAIPLVYLVLRIESSNQSARDQVIAIAVAVVVVVLLVPAVEFVWNLLLAPYRLRIQELETTGQSSTSPREQLEETVRALMKEGNQILDAILNGNKPAPTTWAENWYQRGRHFFEGNLSQLQVMDWIERRRPQRGLTGFIIAGRKQLWDSVKAKIELLEEIDDELRGR